MVDFKIFKIPFVGFFLGPKYIIILNFRQIGEKTAEKMSGNHSVHRRRRRRGRTGRIQYTPYQLRWVEGIE